MEPQPLEQAKTNAYELGGDTWSAAEPTHVGSLIIR
jgi:hypothetical protein